MIYGEDGFEFIVYQEPFAGVYQIALACRNGSTGMQALPVVLEKIKQGENLKPFASLTAMTMQSLFNQLWMSGFRPKDGTGNGGHIEALKYHLEDMRKLVFKPEEK